ncbi:ras guanine nucleotide exchange factor domain-containing protein [Lipomyces doorenjongii]|uniref:ras guanine nucleotide exchange factor domain-containing protein n=1 Tax=Lipomyces doorenjongii TaxID=383834 RepID=UPI0034CFAECB
MCSNVKPVDAIDVSCLSSVATEDSCLWYLNSEYEKELVYDAEGKVKGGTLVALIEHLTSHECLDLLFNTTFLLTYPSFTTPQTFLEQLVVRFEIQAPEGLTVDEFTKWVELKRKPIQLRVLNILKIWLSHYWSNKYIDTENCTSGGILSSIAAVSEHLIKQRFQGASAHAKLVQQCQSGDKHTKRTIVNVSQNIMHSIFHRCRLKSLNSPYIKPLEFARQLTLIDFQLYSRILSLECLYRAWPGNVRSTNSNRISLSPDIRHNKNIKAFIMHSNTLTTWTVHTVLAQTDIRSRVRMIEHLIAVADSCRALKNFSSLAAIVSALYSSPIYRLKKTWGALRHSSIVILASLERLMNSAHNFREYRATLHMLSPPCVPFLGVYLADLTFIMEGNPDMLLREINDVPVINFAKRTKVADIIREIKRFQDVQYSIKLVPELQNMIYESIYSVPSFESMYSRSLNAEPSE